MMISDSNTALLFTDHALRSIAFTRHGGEEDEGRSRRLSADKLLKSTPLPNKLRVLR